MFCNTAHSNRPDKRYINPYSDMRYMVYGTGVNRRGKAILPVHGSSQKIYCNPTHGSASDSNAGTDPNLPMLTPAAAFLKLRDGFGDWLLFPQNTTINKGFGIINQTRRGLGLMYPYLISTYDPADPLNASKYRKGKITFDVPVNETPFYGGFSSGRIRFMVVEGVRFIRTAIPALNSDINGNITCGNQTSFGFTLWSHCKFGVAGGGASGGSHNIWRHCTFDNSYSYGSAHSQGCYLSGWASALGHTFIDDNVAFRLVSGATQYVVGDKWTFSNTGTVTTTPTFVGTGNGTMRGDNIVGSTPIINPARTVPDQTWEVECISHPGAGITFKVTGSVSGESTVHATNITTAPNGNTFGNVIEFCVGYKNGYQGSRDATTCPVQSVAGIPASATPANVGFAAPDYSGRHANSRWHDPADDSGLFTGASGHLVAWIATGYVSTDRLDVVNQGTGPGQIGRSGNDITYEGNIIGVVHSTYDGDGSANFKIDFFKSGTDLRANLTDAAITALAQQIRYWSTAGSPSGTRTINLLLMDCDHGSIADTFRHNFYFATYTYRTVFRNNVSGRACSNGIQMRGGGICTDNLFLDNPINLQLGTGDFYSSYRPFGVYVKASRNTVCGAEGIRNVPPLDGLPRSYGFVMSNTTADSQASGNLFVNHGVGTSNVYAIVPECKFDVPTAGKVWSNRWHNWGSISRASANTINSTFPAQDLLDLQHNIRTNEVAAGTNIDPASLAVPYRDNTRSSAYIRTKYGWADAETMWAAILDSPEINWAGRLKPDIDRGFNMC